MTNLIGDEVEDYRRWLTVPGAACTSTANRRSGPGRKMGHVTRVFAEMSAGNAACVVDFSALFCYRPRQGGRALGPCRHANSLNHCKRSTRAGSCP